MTGTRRKNNAVSPPQSSRDGGIYLYTVVSRLLESVSCAELKFRFRDSINHYGFEGYICDRSLLQPLGDREILEGFGAPKAVGPTDFVASFGEMNLYNDIAQRLGAKSGNYLDAITNASETYFADRHGDQARRFVQRRLTPFLNVIDAPRTHSRLLRAVFGIGRDFGQPAFCDRLSVPIEIAGGQTAFLGLFTQRRPGVGDVLAGVTLTYFYHELCRSRSSAGTDGTAEPVVLGATQLECIKWAVAGKTIEDISVLTGLHYRTVRYHMEQARKRYGYATMRQTLARAACDYGLNPLG